MNLLTPGVYIREVDEIAPPRLGLSVTGFVGQAERGPLNRPQLITSWGQFRDIFGDFTGFSYLAYAVFGFFFNGGERCYVVRVAHETARRAEHTITGEGGDGLIRVTALDEGEWGNSIKLSVEAGAGRFRLIFRYEPEGKLVREEVFDDLSMLESDERYFVRVINGEPEEKDYLKRLQAGNSTLVEVEDLCSGLPSGCSPPVGVIAENLANGSDGTRRLQAKYYTGYLNEAYFRPIPPFATLAERKEISEKLFGLAAFEAVSEIGLVAIPDLIVPDFFDVIPDSQIPKEGIIFAPIPVNVLRLENLRKGQSDLLMHCGKMGDRFAVLDSPRGSETSSGLNPIDGWPAQFRLSPESKYGALYYPWLREKEADFGGRDLLIPPSGHVAGIYSRTERERGVGKAPANEILQGVIDLEFCLTDAEQEVLNPPGVNCLRVFAGRGLRIWGARTLSSDPMWRYVNVRRVCLAIIKEVLVNLQWTVFEPNDATLRSRIRATLNLFFRDLFQSGALAGNKPEEAFFVQCDEETNPPEVVDRGELITRIGFAPARPAEFVLVTIKRLAESLSVSEQRL
jgi:hypothetical protein